MEDLNNKINPVKKKKGRKEEVISLRRQLRLIQILLIFVNLLIIIFVITFVFRSLYLDILVGFYNPPLFKTTYPYQTLKEDPTSALLITILVLIFLSIFTSILINFKRQLNNLPKIYHNFIPQYKLNIESFGISLGLFLSVYTYITIMMFYVNITMEIEFIMMIYIFILIGIQISILLTLLFLISKRRHNKKYVRTIFAGISIYFTQFLIVLIFQIPI